MRISFGWCLYSKMPIWITEGIITGFGLDLGPVLLQVLVHAGHVARLALMTWQFID